MLNFDAITLKSSDLGRSNNSPDIAAPKSLIRFECNETITALLPKPAKIPAK